jgi:hypothetical protein
MWYQTAAVNDSRPYRCQGLILLVAVMACGQDAPKRAEPGDSGSALECDCTRPSDLSMDCACSLSYECLTFEDAVASADCQGASSGTQVVIRRGCGYTLVERELSGGYDAASYLYQGADNVLVGVSFRTEVPYGICASSRYETTMHDLPKCAQVSACDVCGRADWYRACDP